MRASLFVLFATADIVTQVHSFFRSGKPGSIPSAQHRVIHGGVVKSPAKFALSAHMHSRALTAVVVE